MLWGGATKVTTRLIFISISVFFKIVNAGDVKSDVAQNIGDGYKLMYFEDWEEGLPANIEKQMVNSHDLKVVRTRDALFDKALRASVEKGEDFTRVANGKPRAEVVFPIPVRFKPGVDYLINWSTKIPHNFGFYSSQIITQIHQGQAAGSPPIMLALTQRGYVFRQGGGGGNVKQSTDVCCASNDKGKWVRWRLHYRPDSTGRLGGITQLWKDNQLVVDTVGQINAYPNDKLAYLKLGIYMPGDWKSLENGPVEILYGPLSVWYKQADGQGSDYEEN